MEKSLYEIIYALSCECLDAAYSDIEHKEFIGQMGMKLKSLTEQIHYHVSVYKADLTILCKDNG